MRSRLRRRSDKYDGTVEGPRCMIHEFSSTQFSLVNLTNLCDS